MSGKIIDYPSKQRFSAMLPEQLVVLAQKGDMTALEALVKQVQKKVYAALYQLAPERTDIADLTQDVLLRMCRSINGLREPKTFKFWLNRIITHVFYDQLRKGPRQLKTVSMDISTPDINSSDEGRTRDIPDNSILPAEQTLHTELRDKINTAMADLPEQFRTMIVLREIQGLSYEDIAELTQTNLGTVKSRIARARLKLQEALTPYLHGQD